MPLKQYTLICWINETNVDDPDIIIWKSNIRAPVEFLQEASQPEEEEGQWLFGSAAVELLSVATYLLQAQ